MDHQLMNFNIPTRLKRDLDLLARYKHVSRTSILNGLLADYCRAELRHLEDCNRLRSLVRSMSASVTKTEQKVEHEEPVNPMFDYGDDIEEQFSPFR